MINTDADATDAAGQGKCTPPTASPTPPKPTKKTSVGSKVMEDLDLADFMKELDDQNKVWPSCADEDVVLANQIVGPEDWCAYIVEDPNTVAKDCDYVRYIFSKCDLHYLCPNEVEKAFKNGGALGLFHLFLKR